MTEALSTPEPNVAGGLEVDAADRDSGNAIGEMERMTPPAAGSPISRPFTVPR
jgi:hypothetical protein